MDRGGRVLRAGAAALFVVGGVLGLLAAGFVLFMATSPGPAAAPGVVAQAIGVALLSVATLVLAVLGALGRAPRAVACTALASALAGFWQAGGWFVPARFWLAGALLLCLAARRVRPPS